MFFSNIETGLVATNENIKQNTQGDFGHFSTFVQRCGDFHFPPGCLVMSRPIKNNCDYFPHDAGMRNHKKVKAIRQKFPNGYAIWAMILEHITGSDGNVFPYSDIEFELMSGDFGFSVTEIRGVVDYCISLEMLFNKNGFINSESLDERLAPVFEKRNRSKELSKQQLRANGKYSTEIRHVTGVSVTEMPQRKGKETKGKETMLIQPNIKVLGLKSDNYIIIHPKELHSTAYRIQGIDGLKEFVDMNGSIFNHEELMGKYLMARKGKKMNDFQHLWNDYNLFIEKQFA